MTRSPIPIIIISCFLILLCCICLIVLVASWIVSSTYSPVPTRVVEFEGGIRKTAPVVIRPEKSEISATNNTLEILQDANIPIRDLRDLARRLGGVTSIPIAIDPISTTLNIGTQDTFWVSNTDTEENFNVDATLQYVTDHAYFWIENGIQYRAEDLQKLAERFEYQIYPTNHEYFGSEWTPGVDGDPHLYIIYARGLGESLAGYFSSSDEYHPLAHEYSNMHEIFMLNADNLALGRDYTAGVLAHEHQHMIHWYRDRNEAAWINEGFSELASFLNGYGAGGFDYLYASEPDLQLNDWPNDRAEVAPHYGASFLFVVYSLDRMGPQAIQSLVGHPENGLTSMDMVLDELDAVDSLTGERLTADDIFLDWVLASYLHDGDILDGRYTYHGYPDAPQPEDTEVIRSCPSEVESRSVHQFGVDYIRIDCRGEYTLQFDGSVQVSVVPTKPHSGDYYFWSNKGDDSDMSLTKTFDFRDQAGPLTLMYWTWFDLEVGFDYVYLTASTDGEFWQIMTTPAGTPEDPSGNSFGWGYNGLSGMDGSWIQEEVDISQFAGEQVQIRFEYVTDDAVYGDGFLVDDIAIPEVGYFTDFEKGPDGWIPAGFVRIQNVLPQSYRLALIENGENTQVMYIDLDADNRAEIPLQTNGGVDDVVLVVTGTTRFTRQNASYQLKVNP